MRIMYDLDETTRCWLAGGSVGLIPVTSNLHAGHLALVRSSGNQVCIFIKCKHEMGY